MTEAIEKTLGQWPIGKAHGYESLQDDRVYRVSTSSGDYVLKDVGDQWEDSRYEFINTVLEHLTREGFDVDLGIRNRSGDYVVRCNGSRYVLNRYIPPGRSVDLPTESEQFLRSLGAALAKLHNSLLSFPLHERATWREDVTSLHLDSQKLERDGMSRASIQPIEEIVSRREAAYVQSMSGLPEQLIHRDMYLANCITDGPRVVGFIDWELLCVSSPLQDLAYLMSDERWLPAASADVDAWLRHLGCLLTSYSTHREVTRPEAESLPFMMLGWLAGFVVRHHGLQDGTGPKYHAALHLLDMHFEDAISATRCSL
ncbi:MAG: phosphotransferase [Gemmatimonadetes bacterium]|nr:phosphotransferase [Gemmatimonadota bacterium]